MSQQPEGQKAGTARQDYEILSRGGRLTRSSIEKASRPNKPPVHRNRPTALSRYLGEPSIQQYLSDSNIQLEEGFRFNEEYQPNKKLRRLARNHLPQYGFLFKREGQGNAQYFQVQTGKLGTSAKKSSKSSEFSFEENQKAHLPSRHLSFQNDHNKVLTVAQTLLLYPIRLPEFRVIFGHCFAKVQNLNRGPSRVVSTPVLQPIQEEGQERQVMRQLVQSEPVLEMPQQIDIPGQQDMHVRDERDEQFSPQIVIEVRGPAEENRMVEMREEVSIRQMISPEQAPRLEQQHEPQPQDLEALEESLFNKLCLPTTDYILWPAVLLQPIFGERDEIQKMVYRKLDENWKSQWKKSKFTYKLDEEVIKTAHTDPPNEPEGKARQSHDQIVESIKRKKVVANDRIQQAPQPQLIVRLIGTQETLVVQDDFMKWSDLTEAQLDLLIKKSPLRQLIGDLNNYIDDLNRFKHCSEVKMDNKTCFMRLCKYSGQHLKSQLCIPLRSDHNKDDKRVLVRFLRDGPPLDQQDVLGWVEMNKVFANFTLPKQTEPECKFYYLMGNQVSITPGLQSIYADFFEHPPVSFIQALKRCYPLQQINRENHSIERCVSCYYRMENMPYYRCKYCLKYCHQECALEDSRHKRSKLQRSIYDVENQNDVWQCEACSPCKQCHTPVQKDYFKCSTCQQLFHSICGRLKCFNENSSIRLDRQTCQNCFKCDMCDTKLKNQEYIIEENRIFCLNCHKNVEKNNFCIMCMKNEVGNQGARWVLCDDCSHWVHFDCDSFLSALKEPNAQVSEEKKYWCPRCRTKLRRKVLKYVLQELRMFDEYQFFFEPTYEEIIGYRETISHPMCLFAMFQKTLAGSYDKDPYWGIVRDLQLMTRNAMIFNMPKDEIYYRAKILLVIGKRYLETMRPIIECSQYFLLEQNLAEVCAQNRQVFYKDLELNYLPYLLNYGESGGTVQVQRINPQTYDSTYFSSKLLLTCFSNSVFKLRVKKQPQRIQDLFRVPRSSLGGWRTIRQEVCYFHPQERRPIKFKCGDCGQSYCCVTRCLACHFCINCQIFGCACDDYQCACPVLRDKEKKAMESKLALAINLPHITRRQYSSYYTYCPKCCLDVAKINWCYICHDFCYYAYTMCDVCLKVFHYDCQDKARAGDMAILFDGSQGGHNSFENRLQHLCNQCSHTAEHSPQLKEQLMIRIRQKGIQLRLATKFLPIFNYLYEINGIRVTSNQVIQMLSVNQQALMEKQVMLEEVMGNLQTVFESHSINHIVREEYRDFFLKEIARKLSGQGSQQNKEFKQLKQSKKFYKICSKWFPLPKPDPFLSDIDIRFFLEVLTSRMITHVPQPSPRLQQVAIPPPPEPPLRPPTSQQHSSNRQNQPINTKSLERIKIEAITAHVSPKSKKNIYYHNLTEKNKGYLNLWSHHYSIKEGVIMAKLQENQMLDQDAERQKRKQLEDEYSEFQKYLRFRADTEQLGDFLYRDDSARAFLVAEYQGQTMSPFRESWMMVEYNPLQAYRNHQKLYVNTKSEMLEKYLSAFALSIYEENKIVLRKGNTCILGQGKQRWRVLKKLGKCHHQIKLSKQQGKWILRIDQDRHRVRTIEQIIDKILVIAPWVSTFDKLVEFLGLSITDVLEHDPTTRTQSPFHFTNLLQTTPLDDHSRRRRKLEVSKVYDEYEWERQGVVRVRNQKQKNNSRTEFKVTSEPLFFLNKRKNEQEDKEAVEAVRPKVIPFVTFEDLRKDLEDGEVARQKQSVVPRGQPHYNVYIAPSKIDRLGLFIRNWTKKHTVVAEYIGEVISQAIADIRQVKFRHFGCYMFSLGKNNTRYEIIDATFIGNMARYLNHSCDPNCKAKIDISNNQYHIYIYTIRDVKQNEELTYDYQFKVDAQRLVCKCKAKNCQGRLN